MKLTIFLLLLALPLNSFAFDWSMGLGSVQYPDDEWKGFDAKTADRLRKIRELIGRGEKCQVAIYGSMAKGFTMDKSQFVPAALDMYMPKVVACVADLSINPNTVKEVSGCALVSYNSNNGEYTKYFNNVFPTAIAKKPCANGGFEELMQMKGWWSADAWRDSTVEQTLFTPATLNEKWQVVLVYASSGKYVQWFKDAYSRGKTFVAAKKKNRSTASEE